MGKVQYQDMTKGKEEAMDLAEASRQTEWHHPSFVAELFLGRFRTDLISPFPEQDPKDKEIGDQYLAKIEKVLNESVDPVANDLAGKMPDSAMQAMKDAGIFGMKIPKEYGGLGLSQTNYGRALHMIGSHDGSTSAFVSAHQSIGVPTPLKMFGTPEQKKKYLPQLVRDKISAFALTEPSVGSDPAKMETEAVPTADGKHFILNGRKLWCTNGAIADVMIVMAKTPAKIVKGREQKQITAFIVEKTMPGVKVLHRCSFMGLRAIENALLEFKDVKVPAENIVLGQGQGLKLALMTLNTGRLGLPAGTTGGSKKVLEVVRWFAKERVQWGAPIGKHEEIAVKIAGIAATTFAVDAITKWTAAVVDRGGKDIRLEAAMAKLYGSELSWKSLYDGIQILGGRGFEQAHSLKARGERPVAFERMMRDGRINTILEGSTEIMHLFIAREALDAHMRLSADLLNPKSSFGKKLASFGKCAMFYTFWYPRQWLYWGRFPFYAGMGSRLSSHFGYVARTSHKLARSIFHMMMFHQLGLERRQMILARIVEIGTELFAMAATCSYAKSLLDKNPADQTPRDLAHEFCLGAKDRIAIHFEGLTGNHDTHSYKVAQDVLAGKYAWLENDIVRNNM